jgi:hypothetical protein
MSSFQPAEDPSLPGNTGEQPTPTDESLEFVRFCYHRRRVAWPALYDEMCAVAARGAFHGLSYPELAEHGISFSLLDLPRLSSLAQLVIEEERINLERRSGGAPMNLSVVPASS